MGGHPGTAARNAHDGHVAAVQFTSPSLYRLELLIQQVKAVEVFRDGTTILNLIRRMGFERLGELAGAV